MNNLGDYLFMLSGIISLLSAILSFIKASRKENKYYKVQMSRGIINSILTIVLFLCMLNILTMPLSGYIIIVLISFLNLNLSYINYVSLLRG